MPGYLATPQANATGVSVIPSGNISATNVAGALTELDSEKADGSSTTAALALKAPLASPTFTGTTTAASAVVNGDLTVDTNTLYVDSTNNRVGIGTGSPQSSFHVSSSSAVTELHITPYSDNTKTFKVGADNSTGFIDASLSTAEKGSLQLRTSGITRIGIDSSGRITTPYQPTVSATSANAASAGQDIIFGSTMQNRGGAYNTSNGRFTAPVGGSYFVCFQTLMNNGNTGEFRHAIYVNNGGWGGLRFIFYKSAASWQSVYAYGIVNLATNDYITIRYESGSGSIYTDGAYNNFSVFLIG